MVSYEIKPLDTLFFRGNTPMEAGLMVSESLFPPPGSVIRGAFRTELMKQLGIEMNRGNGDKISCDIEAVLVKKGNDLFVPAPATWSVEKTKDSEDNHYKGMKILVAKPISEKILNSLCIKSSEGMIPFLVENKNTEVKSLAGCWVKMDLLSKTEITIKEGDILLSSDIFSMENRTGIEMDLKRKVQEGKLYTARHIRLKEDVSLVVCLNEIPTYESSKISENGILQLGGEKRMCSYSKMPELQLSKLNENYYSFIPVEATEENLGKLVASGKLKVTSGWDLDKKFHKQTVSWIPAGAVFTEEIK